MKMKNEDKQVKIPEAELVKINEHEQVAQSNLILNAMFNAMPDSVFCKDLDRRYIECNKSFEAFIAHKKEDIIGKTYAEVTGDGPAIIKNYADFDTTVITEGKTIVQEDVSMIYKGSERFYDLIKTPLIKKNDAGEDEIIGLLGLMHDVNERYMLIKNLQHVKAHLEIALERANSGIKAKSEFLARMSHELLTPLNAIMGMSQIAKSFTDLNDIQSCIDEIHDNSCHLLRLISNLLEVSSGVGALSESEFSFDALIENVKDRITPYLNQRQQVLNLTIDEHLPKTIVADEKRIERVILHLLTNASKFSQNNSDIAMKIDLHEEVGGRLYLKVSIIDNGIGMTKDEVNKIFNIFEQGDGSSTRKYEGIGIGLTLSKYTVESMGGILFVVSEPGKGSEFFFTVPVSRGPEQLNNRNR